MLAALSDWAYFIGIYLVVSGLFERDWKGRSYPFAASTFGLLGRDALTVVGAALLIVLTDVIVIGAARSQTWPFLVLIFGTAVLGIKRPTTSLSRGAIIETAVPFVLSVMLIVAVWGAMVGDGSSIAIRTFLVSGLLVVTLMLMLWVFVSVCWSERAHVRAFGAALASTFWVFVLIVLLGTGSIWLAMDATRPGGILAPDETARPQATYRPSRTSAPQATSAATVAPIATASPSVTPSPPPTTGPTPDPDEDPYSVFKPPSDCGPWKPSHMEANLLAHGSFSANGSAGWIRYAGPAGASSWAEGAFDEALTAGIISDKSQRIVDIGGERWRQIDGGDWEHGYLAETADWLALPMLAVAPNTYFEGTVSSACDYTFENTSVSFERIASVTYSLDTYSGLPTHITFDIKGSSDDLELGFSYDEPPSVTPPIDMSAPPADCGAWDIAYLLDGMRDQAHVISHSAVGDTSYLRGGKASMTYPGVELFQDGSEFWVIEDGQTPLHWFDTGGAYQPVDWASQQRWALQGGRADASYRRMIQGNPQGKDCLYELAEDGSDDSMIPNTMLLVTHDGTLLQSSYDGAVTTFDYDTFPKIVFPKDVPLRAPETAAP